MEVDCRSLTPVFAISPRPVNSGATAAIDAGLYWVFLQSLNVLGDKRNSSESASAAASEIVTLNLIESFFHRKKAYSWAIPCADDPGDMGADPWDALYLGVRKRNYCLRWRFCEQRDCVAPDASSEYARRLTTTRSQFARRKARRRFSRGATKIFTIKSSNNSHFLATRTLLTNTP